MSIKGKIESLISAGNTTTGEADTDLTSVVQSLVDGYGQGGGEIHNQDKTVVPSESVQRVKADVGYTGLGEVTVDGISTNYVGSAVPRKSSADLTVSGATVDVPSGYYSASASKSVKSGTEGTPTATKGTVVNHSVDITPSVTNVEGYIQGGTKNGSAVKVSASELVSGTLEIDSSGTKDVTNYKNVSVPSGSEGTPTATKGAVSNHAVDVTPSVTNTEGYIQGGTKSGTAVNVSASELVGGTKAITSNGTEDVTNYASVNVAVPNSYDASDEGKVVDGGELVSQSSATYTENGTYDTTLVDDVTVNVQGGGESWDFFDLSKPSGALETDVTSIGTYSAYGRTGITSLSAPNVTTVNTNAFQNCTSLASVSLPSATQILGNAFSGCTALTSFEAKNAHRINGYAFTNVPCPALVFPNITQELGAYALNSFKGQALDFGGSNLNIKNNGFQNASNLTTLILRKSTIATLAATNAFNGTPFASSGTGGTLYVPQALISSYESATNWSTILGYANNQILPIEGSIYETQYADGTPIT